ncbi:MAG TPA: fluoride efflux transporter CrcB [Bacillota bacterium]|nr:fluoride efflux transporter CrcB [Bacillota bacterium]
MTGLFVAVGGALGAISRFSLGKLVARLLPGVFPWGTLIINVLGSFALGVLSGMAAQGQVSEDLKYFLGIGFLGAFTTFSTFGYESVILLEGGSLAAGITYIVASVVSCLIASWLGLNIA